MRVVVAVKVMPPAVMPEALTVVTALSNVPMLTAVAAPVAVIEGAVPVNPVIVPVVKLVAALMVSAVLVAARVKPPKVLAAPVELTMAEVSVAPVYVTAPAIVPPEMFNVATVPDVKAKLDAPLTVEPLPTTPPD